MPKNVFLFFVKNDSKINIKTLNDSKKYIIGCLFKSNNNEFLINNNFPNIEESNNKLENAKKLMKGRIEIWYTDSSMMKNSLEQLKIPKTSVKEIFLVQNNESYFGFNINTSDEIINNWQKILDKMYEDGKILEIFKNHNLEDIYYKK